MVDSAPVRVNYLGQPCCLGTVIVLTCHDRASHDNLANHELLNLAPPAAERIYVGKKKSAHALSQDEICALAGLNRIRPRLK